MSDAIHEGRGWRFYIQDMIECGEKVLSYTDGLDQDAFIADRRTCDATLRNLELIGEAATHIPDAVRQAHPNIQWRSIIGTRNHLAHGYLGIDDDTIWDIIQTDIPNLLPALRNLLDNKSKITIRLWKQQPMSNRMNDVSERLSKFEVASSFHIALMKNYEKISTNSERIARIEGDRKHLATKNEVQAVRTELQKESSKLREEIAEVRTEPKDPKWLIVVKVVDILISLLDRLLRLL